ncbi:MAG: helix-turn-helix transcriptional regulator [Anaerolineaceae bacterium]|nr:helix-turn-helix transcriptional regulator [Anaerolineaceae bacterium]
MTIPILTTKLYVPRPRPDVVPRPRLTQILNEGLYRKLTLISAAAGFGKTTLLSQWIAGLDQPVAWLSLSEDDGDLTRFIAYMVAALRTIAPDAGENTLGMLGSTQAPDPSALLTVLLNEIAAIPQEFVFVLDDYHVLDALAIDEALSFLLQHIPPQMHLVIATREDPPLPLARLRARGQLTELRVAELRFTHEEAAAFLNQMTGLGLSPEAVAALEARTEGWIAGLQMAALSMQGRDDTASFIEAFTGSHRFVLDYLVEEVLHRQSDALRNFLLQTSILDGLNASLCDAVTGLKNSKTLLETLERGNLFVIPLDDTRDWYRYHHLFADALHANLVNEQDDALPDLHLRASIWYEQHDMIAHAIHHALAADAMDRAADLIAGIWQHMDLTYQSKTWLGWAYSLPESIITARPYLCIGCGWALLNEGRFDEAEARLQDAERLLDAEPSDQKTRYMLASIASARTYRFLSLGDIPNTIVSGQRALDLLPDADISHLNRRQAMSLLGIAYWVSGDLIAAERELSTLIGDLFKVGVISDALGLAFIVADVRLTLGRLQDAIRIYKQSLEVAEQQTNNAALELPDLYRGLSDLYREMNDLEQAEDILRLSVELGDRTSLPDWQHRLYVVQAKMKRIEGDLDGAVALLDEAEDQFRQTPLPDAQPASAWRARIWIQQGNLDKAHAWSQQRSLSPDDGLHYMREFEHITLARLLLAQSQRGQPNAYEAAVTLLERLYQSAHEGGRIGRVIEIRNVQALALATQGDLSAALPFLQEALSLAEPQGFVRIFVDEGTLMASLLYQALQAGIAPAYVTRLIAAFGGNQESAAPLQTGALDPLSDRELDVLRLLGTDLTGPEIADQLMVSLNTMRTHSKNIYSKLGVNSRRAAVRRAEELNLI